MGLVNFGVPYKETEFLRKNMVLDIFVEGGTYKGGTAKKMSKIFRKVFTIEKSDAMYNIAKDNLKGAKNVTVLKGDTREYLANILDENDNIIFWLDAHWSGGDTYGENDECPLIEELEIIFKYQKNYVVLIDDARLFLAPPPKPHNFRVWPSIKDILNSIPQNWSLIEYEDVIYLYPLKIEDELKEFIQNDLTQKIKRKNNVPFFIKILKRKGLIK